ncbi:hypothetical protein T11_6705 [Trichinella zimbabwensis]|uniref:Uncharacterized protein n=1 Tax=Trichinella zimbabwensis TaxID=268475 RepID=A0A0V1G7F1_9BILA|nr:hypothetical protein T11_6705 [Trichinella zimbabwensis]
MEKFDKKVSEIVFLDNHASISNETLGFSYS